LCGGVEEHVLCEHAEALYDGGASAQVVDGVAVALAADDVLAAYEEAGVEVVDGALAAGAVTVALAADGILAAETAPAVPSLEPGEEQMNRPHEGGQAQKGERFPEPLEFLGQLELRLPEEFPKPSAPARRMVVVPRLAAPMAIISLPGQSHSHRPGVLEIAGYLASSPLQPTCVV